MRIFLMALLFWGALAHAAPPASDTESIEPTWVERGLLQPLSQVKEAVGLHASDLVLNAMGFLGVPYKRGGTDARTGFDCSGFVRSMYEQTLGLVLPRRAEEQARATTSISKDELRPGDLVFFNTMRRAFSHVGIYVGDGKFIHAPRTGQKVRVEDMREAYWTKRFNGARRVSEAEIDPAVLSSDLLAPR
jgi:cell wall-associated NlpC family hydrolase